MPISEATTSGVVGEGDVFIQYKGTDICADFTCPECGETEHIDGAFCYVWKCPNCGRDFQLSSYIKLYEVKP